MIGRDKWRRTATSHHGAGSDDLTYVIEIWNLPRTDIERVVARAETMLVATAIFDAAVSENPGRRLVLRQGARVIQDRS